VQNAWTAAGLPQPVPALTSAEVGPDEVRTVVEGALARAGATRSSDSGDHEVPRSSADILARLEEFYHRLYPQTRGSASRHHFHYEEVEWLGEF
jgi:hypothetical protein